MTVVVKARTDLVVPASVRRRAGIKTGDKLEFMVSGGVIHIVPKVGLAAQDLTAAQKRAVDRDLAKGLKDVALGRMSGPFENHREFIESLHQEAAKLSARRKARAVR
jgi:AbrB family looped-hinge helix DNA binding protein